jgi:plastocyanin
LHRLATLAGIFLSTVVILAAAVTAAAAPSGQGGAPATQPSGPTLRLDAGRGSGTVSIEEYSDDHTVGERMVRIAVGTTLTWSVTGMEPHTVTFLAGKPKPALAVPQPEDPVGRPPMFNPDFFFPSALTGPWDGSTYVNSGELDQGQSFSLTFSKAGTYPYLCLFHSDAMQGTVQVVAAGTAGISTQASVDRSAAEDAAEYQPRIALINSTRNVPGVADGPNGTQIWSVRAGSEWHNGHIDFMAFMPSDVTVRQGDTVLWYIDNNAPHTVTFHGDDNAPTDVIMLQLPDGTMMSMDPMAGPPPPPPGAIDPSQMPRLVVGPGAMPFKASPTHNGHSTYNSGLFGIFGNEPVVPGAPNTFALTFDVPGTFHYECELHESLGMVGNVIVLPR